MHKLAEKIAECLKAKVEGKGIDNIEGQELMELGMWTDILKDIACYDKDMRIIKAMDKEEKEDEEDEKYFLKMLKEEYGMEDEEARRYYRGQPRSRTTGRFMRRGDGRRSNRGGRRGYEEMMMPDYDMDEMEYMRDMDRGMHRMYYAGESGGGSSRGGSQGGYGGSQGMSGGQSGGGQSSGGGGGSRGYSEGGSYGQYGGGRDSREGRSGQARRGYMETKEMHRDNSQDSKQKKMKELEKYMGELSADITEMINDASPEEKTMLKSKLNTLAQKVV